MNEDRAKWEWPTDEIKRVGYQVVDLIAEHLTSLPERPVFQPYPRTLAEKLLETAPPATGASADESVAEFRSDIEPYPFGNGHPRFFGWVNSPPAVIGIFAEARAATTRPSTLSGTPLEQKLNQLSLSSMSRQLETTLTEAAAKNLSAAATLEWLADLEIEARSQRAMERGFRCSRLQTQPSIDAFHFHHHKSRRQAKPRLLRLLDLSFLAKGTNIAAVLNRY